MKLGPMQPRGLHPISRRGLLRGMIAAGTLGAVGAANPPPTFGAGASVRIQTDADVLLMTLGIEQLVVFVYQHVLGTGALSARARTLIDELLSHERAHAQTIGGELTLLGGAPAPGPADVTAADKALAARHVSLTLTKLGTERDCVRLLMAVESVAEGAYFSAISKLGDRALLRTAAQIMACEAQHATVLSRLLHPVDLSRAVPDAFVQGRS